MKAAQSIMRADPETASTVSPDGPHQAVRRRKASGRFTFEMKEPRAELADPQVALRGFPEGPDKAERVFSVFDVPQRVDALKLAVLEAGEHFVLLTDPEAAVPPNEQCVDNIGPEPLPRAPLN